MQLIPVFKIGIWNAWIFTACFYILPYPIMAIFKKAFKKLGNPPDLKPNKREKAIGYIANIITYIAILYSIFLPFKLETAWFYIGLAVFLLALAVLATTVVNFITTPIDKAVTKGIYGYSRNPMYLSNFLALIGIGIAAASWIILLFAVIFIISANIVAISEEHYCKEKYGDVYKEYLNRTPRWIGIPKS
jgi:protein-S-isoprenylcysteine O-methyltransferase Ste14